MWALLLVPLLVIILVGGYFLAKAFMNITSAMAELKNELGQLGEMGPRLQRLADDVGQLTDSMEERNRQ